MSEEIELEVCRYCGQTVMVMCQKGTGFCSAKCEEDFAERGVCRADGESTCYCRKDDDE